MNNSIENYECLNCTSLIETINSIAKQIREVVELTREYEQRKSECIQCGCCSYSLVNKDN